MRQSKYGLCHQDTNNMTERLIRTVSHRFKHLFWGQTHIKRQFHPKLPVSAIIPKTSENHLLLGG